MCFSAGFIFPFLFTHALWLNWLEFPLPARLGPSLLPGHVIPFHPIRHCLPHCPLSAPILPLLQEALPCTPDDTGVSPLNACSLYFLGYLMHRRCHAHFLHLLTWSPFAALPALRELPPCKIARLRR